MTTTQPAATFTAPDKLKRCSWCASDPIYISYHDNEWGRPVHDDNKLFEKICLEGFQAGLSWLTILRKRENFRTAFKGFDPQVVAKFTSRDVERLMKNEGIVRNRMKIEATIANWARLMRSSGRLRRRSRQRCQSSLAIFLLPLPSRKRCQKS
jgi:DNA-3-methyladenine glycosylase I